MPTKLNKGNNMGNIFMRGLIGTAAFALSLSVSTVAFAEYKGFGDNIPLENAARQIVPSDYSIKYEGNVDKKTPLSWKSSSDWKSALSTAASKKGLNVKVEGNDVVISGKSEPKKVEYSSRRPYASNPSEKMVQKKSHSQHVQKSTPPSSPRTVEEANVGGGGFMIRPYHQGAAASAPTKPAGNEKLVGKEIKEQKNDGWKPVAGSEGQYVVAPGYMLRTTLTKWSEAAGWHLVWKSDFDYAITTGATFSGDFVGASKQLLTAMKDARPTITADFFTGNKTVVISNNMADEVN